VHRLLSIGDKSKVAYLQNARVYKCNAKHDRQKFSLKVGTVFEESAIPSGEVAPCPVVAG
jgi:hypothetical protein